MLRLSVLIESVKEKEINLRKKRTIIAKFFNNKDQDKVLREYRSCKFWEKYINEFMSLMLYINEYFNGAWLSGLATCAQKPKVPGSIPAATYVQR